MHDLWQPGKALLRKVFPGFFGFPSHSLHNSNQFSHYLLIITTNITDCEISGSHGGQYEEDHLLGCRDV
jgi:hypothetical protein